MYLRPLEEMAARLEATAPRGLPSVKERFAQDTDGLPGTHLEIAVAYNCSLAGHTFEFGGKGKPDLLITGNHEPPLDLEITRATLDDLWGLAEALKRDIGGANIHLTIEADPWPARIPSAERNETRTVIEAAVRAAGNFNPWNSVVTLPISGARVAARLTRPLLDPISRVVIAGGDSTRYLADLGGQFQKAVEEKCGQYRRQKWPPYTVLVVDVGSATFGWARSDADWLAWLMRMVGDWSSVEFAAVAACLSQLHGTNLRGACLARPEQDAATASRIAGVMTSIGLMTG